MICVISLGYKLSIYLHTRAHTHAQDAAQSFLARGVKALTVPDDADQKQRQLRVRGPEVREPQHIEALEVPGAWAPLARHNAGIKKAEREQHEN